MLGGFGFDFPCGCNVGNQRQVHEQCPGRPQLQFQLPDGLKKRLALNVTGGAPDLDHSNISPVGAFNNTAFDFVGDVGNNLHRATQIIASPLLAQHRVVDPAGSKVIALAHGGSGKAFVVTQVQVRLGTVVGHEYLAMLERTHGSGIEVDVGIQFQQRDLQATGFQHRSQ